LWVFSETLEKYTTLTGPPSSKPPSGNIGQIP